MICKYCELEYEDDPEVYETENVCIECEEPRLLK